MNNFKPRGGDRGGDRGGFRPAGRSFSRPSFGGGNRGGNDRGPVTMHQAICAECGNSCEVPFRPSGDKPVYCSNCFGSKKGFDERPAPRRDFDRPSFAPRNDSNSRPAADNSGEVKKQLETMNSKLERIIVAVEKLSQANKSVAIAEVVAKAKEEKPVAIKKAEKPTKKEVAKKVVKSKAKKK
ncbi:MAG: CxxC-x17-CxxC domain-containing protein [bacterium]